MASTPTDKAAQRMACKPGDTDWESEMQVTFDSAELASFFDGFDPLEVLADPDCSGSEQS